MGKDKEENEELLKYAWPEDVWYSFHDLLLRLIRQQVSRRQAVFGARLPALTNWVNLGYATST
jgi:hypothetical protein